MNTRKINVQNNTKYIRQLQDWYVSHKICCICHENEVYKDKRKCLMCLMDARNVLKEYRKKDNTELKYKKYCQNKRRNDLCIAFGVCVQCKKRDVLKGHVHCEFCLAKKRNKQKQQQEAKGNIPRYLRTEYGLCYNCGKNPIMEGKKVCSDCIVAKRKAIEICRSKCNNDNHPWRIQDRVMYGTIKNRKNEIENINKEIKI